MAKKFTYYYYVENGDGDFRISGTDDKNELITCGFHTEYTALETFTTGPLALHLLFHHLPREFTITNEPKCFVTHQYNIRFSNMPLFIHSYNSYDECLEAFLLAKKSLSGALDHRAPLKYDLTDEGLQFFLTKRVTDIFMDIRPFPGGERYDEVKILKILDAAVDEKGYFLYPLYARVNHPVETFWVRMLKFDIKYYGIVYNKLNNYNNLSFNYLDVVSFGIHQINKLL